MLWKLGLGGYCLLIVGALGLLLNATNAERDARAVQAHDFHARNVDCLARNVYYEARGESLEGQYAVAEVTMNRKASLGYPKTVCEVVFQKDAFSWTAMRSLGEPSGEAWQRALKVAQDVYYGSRPSAVQGATHYHATYVKPDWSGERERIARIGRHVFYR